MTDAEDLSDVSRETREKLRALEALVKKWSPRVNLVAPSTLKDVWTRHILDSAQVFSHAPASIQSWADLGSGGGFPGLVIAVLAKGQDMPLDLTLIESDARKCAFLSTAKRELDLSFTVLNARIESVEPLDVDVVSARALAPLPNLIELAQHHLNANGVLLAPKGASFEQEIASALESWSFHCEKYPSRTSEGSAILGISEIARL